MIACHYSDGTTVIADDVDACPAFRDNTGGQLIGTEPVYPSGVTITKDVSASALPSWLWWLALVGVLAYEKASRK
jgi:hypothetical protein